jgi:hypothetical protein
MKPTASTTAIGDRYQVSKQTVTFVRLFICLDGGKHAANAGVARSTKAISTAPLQQSNTA